MEKSIRFVWFWTFWHWSKESSRTGLLVPGPLAGIGCHWENWFQHAATEEDRRAIEEIGETRAAQSQFTAWLFQHWAKESDPTGNRLLPRFVLGQLAGLAPFSTWSALTKYQTTYGSTGMPAVVLAEASAGESPDVRSIEAIVIPAENSAAHSRIVSEGFKADTGDLDAPRQLATSLLAGKVSGFVLVLWFGVGRRPHARGLAAVLSFGWIALALLLGWLLFGPEPGEKLLIGCGLLLIGWSGLVLVALVTALRQSVHFRREGKAWATHLAQCQTRLRMPGGLTIKGGSAGLAFALNTLLANYRAQPGIARRSWIWRRFFQAMDRDSRTWAATGVVTPDGWIQPVVIEPKLRACFQHGMIRDLLTPRQRSANVRTMTQLDETLGAGTVPENRQGTDLHSPKLGFAAEKRELRLHRCGHVAEALLTVGDLWSRGQIAINLLAIGVSLAVVAALPDLRSILFTPPPPAVVGPASPSPYYLWVSLDTPRATDFQIVLESRFWINRRVHVDAHDGPNASTRGEIRLLRLSHSTTTNTEDATVWVERRRKILFRDYAPGERVGQYSLSYLNHLGRE